MQLFNVSKTACRWPLEDEAYSITCGNDSGWCKYYKTISGLKCHDYKHYDCNRKHMIRIALQVLFKTKFGDLHKS